MPSGDFWFNNVGQGLFYSGKITEGNKEAYIVYDCGTKSSEVSLANIVKNAISGQTKHLNLLVISHFDSDHINGLSVMLGSIKEIDLVVMPYITVEESVLLACADENPSNEYLSFLANYEQFFASHEVSVSRYVLLTHSENDDDSIDDIPLDDVPPTDDFSKYRDKKSEKDFKQMYFQIQEKNKFHVCFDTLKYNILGAWIFEFYVSPTKKAKLKNFEEAVKDLLKEKNLSEIKDLLADISALSDFNKIYHDQINTNINNTSVVMLHYPYNPSQKQFYLRTSIFHKSLGMCTCPCFAMNPWIYPYYSINKPATLLLGDITLKGKVKKINKHFKLETKNVGIALVPHHGSIRSWDEAIFDKIDKEALWVVSHGIDSQYRHPNNAVIESFNKKCRCLLSSNEDQKIVIGIVSQ